MARKVQSEEKTLNKVNTLSTAQMESIQYFWHDADGAHISTITQERYDRPQGGDACYEVLITSIQIIFRKGVAGISGNWRWTNLGIYANDGISLKDYAQMNANGIILGDVNNIHYQLVLSPSKGLILNEIPIAISDYSTENISVRTSTQAICLGYTSDDSQTITFCYPTSCFVPEGTPVVITELVGMIADPNGITFVENITSPSSWLVSPYEITAFAVGGFIRINIHKTTGKFNKGSGTLTKIEHDQAQTVIVNSITWRTDVASRNLRSRSITEEESE